MAEENKTVPPPATESAAATDKAAAPVAETVAIPTLAEDVAKLELINRRQAVVLRMQGGRHPDPEIEALLQRRLNIPREEFQGPYVTRLAVTTMMIFIASTALWAILWAIGTALELNYSLRLISTGMATLLAAIAGVAVFHPASVPDEKKLIAAIEEHMNELRMELGKSESAGNTSGDPTKASVTVDNKLSTATADAKADSKQDSRNGTPASEVSTAAEKASDKVSA